MSNAYDDAVGLVDDATVEKGKEATTVQPLYQVYQGSRIAVSRQSGKRFMRMRDAALVAHEAVIKVWDECYKYYNANHLKTLITTRGMFKRGDGTENIFFSNLNIILPAVYGKDPNITCSTSDDGDEPFSKALEALINALFRRRDGLKAKAKIKKVAGNALLTNAGVLKLDFAKKDDSREQAIQEMERITRELGQAQTQEELDDLYGQIEALEMGMEVMLPSGFSLSGVLAHNLIVDPNAEEQDGTDAEWMMERCWYPTAGLQQRYTRPEDENDKDNSNRVLLYKPTHKAKFSPGGDSARDDGLGFVLEAIETGGSTPTAHTEDERTSYMYMYMTECYKVWDRTTRRVFLFHRDDWTWPLWVWDDPLNLTRFFPYFIISFDHSTGGTYAPGAMSYTFDQQDEINDMNRQKSRIRRAIFDFFYYNSDKIDPSEMEKFAEGLRGEGTSVQKILGIRAGELALKDVVESVAPPAAHYDTLFDTKPVIDSVNRITNISDAIRGVQFKTNTNVAAVQSYEQSLRLSVGAKVDVIEDVVADVALAVAEIAVQNYDQEVVAGYIGPKLAQGWKEMSLDDFNAQYSLTVVAGSMEKPNSVFKKKEAVEVAQAIGQFAQAAPGATLMIMLRVLQQAFTDIVIKPEDWDAIRQEIAAQLQRGDSTGGAGGASQPGQQQQQSGQQQQPQPQQNPQELVKRMDPRVKQKIVQMHQQGVPEQQIVQFIQQHVGANNGTARPEPAQQ